MSFVVVLSVTVKKCLTWEGGGRDRVQFDATERV